MPRTVRHLTTDTGCLCRTLTAPVNLEAGAASWGGNTEDLDLLCTQARIPGKTILTVDRQIGIEPIKIGVGHVLPEVSLTFYLTGTYSARDYFQEWIECIVSSQPPFVAGFLADYGHQVTIEQLDKQANKIYGG